MFETAVLEHGDSPMGVGAVKRHVPGGPEAPATPKVKVKKRRDADEEARRRQLHTRLMGYYRREKDRQALNRLEQDEDEEFYDNYQWSETELEDLRDTDQLPMVYNVIATTVNWVIGTEKRGRFDYKVLARRKGEGKAAERKTQLLKYLSDVNSTPFERSRAFEDAAKVGIGWLECGIQAEDDGEPIYARYESWRNMLWDSAATTMDLSDARYIIRQKWTDVDVATSMFPDQKTVIEQSAETTLGLIGHDEDGDEPMDAREMMEERISDDAIYGYSRQRVRLIEVWFKQPVRVELLKGGDRKGEVYDETDWRHQLDKALHGLISRTQMVVHVAIMTTSRLLYVEKSPYRHNEYPFTPIWCYRRGKTGLPYGMIRGLKMMQRDINKRGSKALAILCSNKIIMDEGAVRDPDSVAEEVSRPNAVIVTRPNKRFEINADRELHAAHLDLMGRTIAMIQSVSGVTDELLGRQTNASSGKAIGKRQDQGQLSTASLFENLRFGSQKHGQKELSLQEQYYTEQKSFRITNARGKPEYPVINDGLPANDIARTKADFVISEQDWRASVRQAQTEELMALLQQLAPTAPQLALVMMDLVVESMDLPQREEIVKRIRQVTGMPDPDAEEPSPEDLQRQKTAAEAEARRIAMEDASIAEKQASALLKSAQATTQKAQAGKISADKTLANVQALSAALEAALAMLATREIAPVADSVLADAGYSSADPASAADAAPAPLPPPMPPAGPPEGVPQPLPQTEGVM